MLSNLQAKFLDWCVVSVAGIACWIFVPITFKRQFHIFHSMHYRQLIHETKPTKFTMCTINILGTSLCIVLVYTEVSLCWMCFVTAVAHWNGIPQETKNFHCAATLINQFPRLMKGLKSLLWLCHEYNKNF